MGLSVPLLYCTSDPMYSSAAAYRYMRREMNEGGVMCFLLAVGDTAKATLTFRSRLAFYTAQSIPSKLIFPLYFPVL